MESKKEKKRKLPSGTGKTSKEDSAKKKSNITFSSLKGKLFVAPDCWEEDLKRTVGEE